MNVNNPQELFNKIYDDTNVKTLIYITSKCGDTDQINDIFQETYMELYQIIRKKNGDYIQNAEALVIKIAKQKIFRHYRIRDKLKNIIPLEYEDSGDENIEVLREEEISSIEEEMIQKETVEYIWKFLQSKPVEIRKIFYLYYYMNLSIAEIAEALSTKESTIKNKLYRTINEFRNRYREEL